VVPRENEDGEPVLSFSRSFSLSFSLSLSLSLSCLPLLSSLCPLSCLSRRNAAAVCLWRHNTGFERANRHSQSCTPVTYVGGRVELCSATSRGIKWWGAKGASAENRDPHDWQAAGCCYLQLYSDECGSASSGIVPGVLSFFLGLCVLGTRWRPWRDRIREELWEILLFWTIRYSSRIRYGPCKINRSVVMRSLENAPRKIRSFESDIYSLKLIEFISYSSKVVRIERE